MCGLIEQTLRCHPKQSRQSEPQISPALSGNHSHLNPAAGWKGFEDYSERSLSFNQSAKPLQARVALVRRFRLGEEVGSERCSGAQLIRLQSNYFHTLTIGIWYSFFFFVVVFSPASTHRVPFVPVFPEHFSAFPFPSCIYFVFAGREEQRHLMCTSFILTPPPPSPSLLPPMCVAQLKSFRLVILEVCFRVCDLLIQGWVRRFVRQWNGRDEVYLCTPLFSL